MGKRCPRNNFWNFILVWNIQKWPLQGEGGEVASALVLKSICTFTFQKRPFMTRISLLFSRINFLFPEIIILFSRSEKDFNSWSLLDNLKISTWNMIFYIFCSILILHDSSENAVFEHSEWLKFQTFSGGSVPKTSQRCLQHSSDHSALSRTVYSSAKIRWNCKYSFNVSDPTPFF